MPLGKTALNLNFDMILPLGVPESVVVTGADRTTALPAVKAAAEKNGLEIEADQRAHLGIFYRSDHFSLARAGVPAFSIGTGMKIKGKPKDYAVKAMKEFNDTAYHSPQDEFREDWDFRSFTSSELRRCSTFLWRHKAATHSSAEAGIDMCFRVSSRRRYVDEQSRVLGRTYPGL